MNILVDEHVSKILNIFDIKRKIIVKVKINVQHEKPEKCIKTS